MAVSNQTYGTMYYVDDMEEAVSYYKKLGFKPGAESPEWTEFPVGNHNICLHARNDDSDDVDGGILIMKVEGVKSLYEKLKKDGMEPEKLKEVHPGHWSFDLCDPSGNPLSFYGTP